MSILSLSINAPLSSIPCEQVISQCVFLNSAHEINDRAFPLFAIFGTTVKQQKAIKELKIMPRTVTRGRYCQVNTVRNKCYTVTEYHH